MIVMSAAVVVRETRREQLGEGVEIAQEEVGQCGAGLGICMLRCVGDSLAAWTGTSNDEHELSADCRGQLSCWLKIKNGCCQLRSSVVAPAS